MKRMPIAILATAILATAILLPAPPALAQTTLALTVGANFASLDIDSDVGDSGARVIRRRSIGLATTIPLSTRLGLHLDGSYSEKGASFADRHFFDYRGALELDYLELRVLGKVQVFESEDGAELHLLIGPSMARQTSCQRRSQLTSRGRTTESRVGCRVDSNSTFDLGVAGGGWLEMWFSDRYGILLSALFTQGLHDIDRSLDDVTMRTRALSLHAGFIVSPW